MCLTGRFPQAGTGDRQQRAMENNERKSRSALSMEPQCKQRTVVPTAARGAFEAAGGKVMFIVCQSVSSRQNTEPE
ncbi:hypothetical protein SRHO_G00062620 [Serrasalmus rhombeus]